MDVANEILDAIEIIVDKKIRENTVQIYPGVCKSVSGNSCVMSINGRDNTVQFYGSTPTVGTIYRVFVPNSNMSMAFIIAINDDSSSAKSASIFVIGLSETDSVKATHKIPGQVVNPEWKVPEGYTQLEYIESTGTQYIDTGYHPQKKDEISAKFVFTKISSEYDRLMGSADNNSSNNAKYYGICPITQLNGYFDVDYFNWSRPNTIQCIQDTFYDFYGYFDNGDQHYIINNMTMNTAMSGFVDTGYTYFIFSVNASGTPKYGSTNSSCCFARLYQLSIDNAGRSIRKFIPAKRNSDSAVGMYDLVTNEFFGNSGTGTFTAGAEIPQYIDGYVDGKTIVGKWSQKPNPEIVVPDGYTQLEYIESTGTQYINTGLSLYSSYIMTKSVSIGYGYIYGVDNYTSGIGNCNLTTDGSYVNVGWGTAWVSMHKASYNKTEKTSITRISDGSSTNFTVNGVSYSAISSGYSSNPSSFYVFARNNSASGAPSYEASTDLKLYSLSFYTSADTCVRDFIPAKRNSDGAIGMYDLVTKAFFENSGTGTFIAGPEIPQTIDGFLIDKIKDYGTWTVTATNGTNTVTQDVLVDADEVFTVEVTL